MEEKNTNNNLEKNNNISDKFNLMLINFSQIESVEERLGNGDYTGLLYGMPVIIRHIGKNTERLQEIVSDMSKYSHPNLTINYGIMLKPADDGEERVYIVRDLVQGKNFYSSANLNNHNKLVVIYKMICVFEFLHSFDVFYIFLHPNNIIIGKDISVKIIDLIKDNEMKLEEIRKNPFNDEMRFFCPDLYNPNIDTTSLLNPYVDIYSIGCHIFYAFFQELPWKNYNTKEEILNAYLNKETFLEDESRYGSDSFNISTFKIVSKCLSKDYSSIDELKNDLEEFEQIDRFIKDDFVDVDYEKGMNSLRLNFIRMRRTD